MDYNKRDVELLRFGTRRQNKPSAKSKYNLYVNYIPEDKREVVSDLLDDDYSIYMTIELDLDLIPKIRKITVNEKSGEQVFDLKVECVVNK